MKIDEKVFLNTYFIGGGGGGGGGDDNTFIGTGTVISLSSTLREFGFRFTSDQARKNRSVQNESARLIGKQLETLLLVLYYLRRICGFHF